MRVAELIEMLGRLPPNATVVLHDASGQPQPAVRRLRSDDVSEVMLGTSDKKGMAILEVWRDDGTMEGPHRGVLLGSLDG